MRWLAAFVCLCACGDDAATVPDAGALGDAAVSDGGAAVRRVPRIDGAFWQLAGNPDLGALTGASQQPVDFAIWQAADGTWQLQSCIRATQVGGNSRLLYRWQGAALTDRDWTPIGVAMTADP